MFHSCLKVLVENAQAVSEETLQVRVDGRYVNIKLLLAVITGDHPQQALHCLSRNGCLYCRCPLDQFDDTTRVYEPITVQEQERLISEICDAYLDENGKIKPGKITEFHQAEQKLGFRILRNAWWGVSDTCFCLQIDLLFSNFPQTPTDFSPPLLSQYKPLGTQMQVHMSAPPCWIHHLVIGLWAKHIMKSIVFLYKSTLQRDDLRKPSGERLISNAAVDRVCDRLGQRLTCFTADDAGLKITPKYAKHLFNVSVNDKGTFTAGRVEILIVAYHFVLRDLIYNVVLHINEKLMQLLRATCCMELIMSLT